MSDIHQWLEELDLGQCAEAFEANEIDAELGRDVRRGTGYYRRARHQEA